MVHGPAEPAARTILHSSVFHTLEDRGVHRELVRSAVPYPDREAIVSEHNRLANAMQRARDEASKPLLVDLRSATGRADPEFEQAMAIWRVAFLSGHPRLVVLVASMEGQGHVRAHLRSDGIEGNVLFDEEEARAMVRGGKR